jgi:hypothetical protein
LADSQNGNIIVLSLGTLRLPQECQGTSRPENWLVRQLNDEPKPVYKVGFIREKGKATAGEE